MLFRSNHIRREHPVLYLKQHKNIPYIRNQLSYAKNKKKPTSSSTQIHIHPPKKPTLYIPQPYYTYGTKKPYTKRIPRRNNGIGAKRILFYLYAYIQKESPPKLYQKKKKKMQVKPSSPFLLVIHKSTNGVAQRKCGKLREEKLFKKATRLW